MKDVERPLWIAIKIFPKVNNPLESFIKIINLKSIFLKELKQIAGNNDYYFLHYTDVPEGPHFKFILKSNEKLKEILDWKIKTQSDDLIKYIEIIIEEHDVSKEEANMARKIFESLNLNKVKFLDEIKTKLNSNGDYNDLTNDGKHFVRNMLGLNYSEEIKIIEEEMK